MRPRYYIAQSDSGPDNWYEPECVWNKDHWRCNGKEVELAGPGSLPEVTCDWLKSAL